MAETKQQDAATKKRSEAAKKAAATRKAKAEAEAAATEQSSQESPTTEGPTGSDESYDSAPTGSLEAEAEAEAAPDRSLTLYSPKRVPLKNAGLDQYSVEEKRQAELAEERRIHNARTDGVKY